MIFLELLARLANVPATCQKRHEHAIRACAERSGPVAGPYSRTTYDISQASDWSRWPSQPIRNLQYI